MNGWAEKLQAKDAVSHSSLPRHPVYFFKQV